MSEYIEMAEKFLRDTNTSVKINFHDTKQNPWNTDGIGKNWYHNIYKVTIKRNGQQFTVIFTDSAENYRTGKEPTVYDILACLTKYGPGTFENFCSEFGYEMWAEYPEESTREGYNKSSYKTYKAVVKEYENVMKLFSDCIDQLAEIN